ncbi:uncharacterized protein BXZ73DRAFT_76870 [Epithele typhae]|uniref:uncharacterized protein n=1 Tax=Epithele typhae TaxID=378194 RepID=UPI002007920D|nr:uncharacterized protein BXZ73DRAFT_76870 [Epithele typhae]KAH9935170.1 hypothetical protein BXZ73DRAFT_76870 [Epithele typhae]
MVQRRQFCPLPSTYAAMRIDPVAMVQRLRDPYALAAAEKMQPQTYLVFISEASGLPGLYGTAYFYYTVDILGTVPPPREEVECFEPDMCIPIFPNDTHPTGRKPIHTRPSPFAFRDCFHWPSTKMMIRVRPREGGWNVDDGYVLPGASLMRMGAYWEEDAARAKAGRQARSGGEAVLEVEDAFETESSAMNHGVEEGSDSSSSMADLPSSSHEPTQSASQKSLPLNDPLGDMFSPQLADDPELLPIVDLWYDLENHLKQEDIPYPNDIFKERDEIIK